MLPPQGTAFCRPGRVLWGLLLRGPFPCLLPSPHCSDFRSVNQIVFCAFSLNILQRLPIATRADPIRGPVWSLHPRRHPRHISLLWFLELQAAAWRPSSFCLGTLIWALAWLFSPHSSCTYSQGTCSSGPFRTPAQSADSSIILRTGKYPLETIGCTRAGPSFVFISPHTCSDAAVPVLACLTLSTCSWPKRRCDTASDHVARKRHCTGRLIYYTKGPCSCWTAVTLILP